MSLLGNQVLVAQDDSKDSFSFGGHVFSEFFPIEHGYVYLYSYPDLTLVDQEAIDTLGYYYFYRKPAGQYLVYAGLTLDDPNFGQFAFTYYPKSAIWEDAEIIEIQATSWEYDIKLINQEEDGLGQGNGKISGIVTNTDAKPMAENVDVILFSNEMESITHVLTNSNGQFLFDKIETGSYILYPQITGMTTEPIFITISDENSQHTDIAIEIKNGMISSSINETIIQKNSFKLFPNPASNNINLQFITYRFGEITTKIYDLNGRMLLENSDIFHNELYSGNINTSEWPLGMYLVEVYIDGEMAIQQKLVIIR
jgi:hypothetical protein